MPEKLWNREYILFLIVNAVGFLGFQILIPLVPVYGLRFTSSESVIGFLAASIALAAMFMRPVAGYLANRYNCNRMILIMQFGTMVIVLMCIFAPNIGTLIMLRLAQGLVFGLGATAIATAAIRTMPEQQIGRGIGILSVAGIGSQAVAPIIGLWLVDNWGYPALFIFTSATALAAGIIAWSTKLGSHSPAGGETKAPKFSLKELFAVEAAGFVVLMIIITMTVALPLNFIVVHAQAINIPNIGVFFTIYAGVLVEVRFFLGGLADKYSYKTIIPPCAALCAVALAIIGGASSFPPLCVAAGLLGLGFGIAGPAIQLSMIRIVSIERRGTANASYFLGMDFAYVVGPVVMGFIAETTNFNTGFYFFVLPTLAAIPLTFIFSRKRAV